MSEEERLEKAKNLVASYKEAIADCEKMATPFDKEQGNAVTFLPDGTFVKKDSHESIPGNSSFFWSEKALFEAKLKTIYVLFPELEES